MLTLAAVTNIFFGFYLEREIEIKHFYIYKNINNSINLLVILFERTPLCF